MLPSTSIHGKYGFGLLILCLLIVSFSFAYGGKEGGPFRSFRQVQAISSVFKDSIPPQTRPAGSTLDNRSVLDKELSNQAIEKALKNVECSVQKLEEVLKQMRFNMDHHLKINLQNAARGLQSAKASLQQLKAFTNDLEKDGLIEKDRPNSIEIKDGDLYINDAKQPKKVIRKYREKYEQYFEGKQEFEMHFNGAEQDNRALI